LQWTADRAYTLHIENCIFPGNTLSNGWLPVLNTTIIIRQLYVKTIEPIIIEENAFNDNNFQNITYLTLEGSIEQLNKKCFAGLQYLNTLEINGGPIQSVAGGILNDLQNLLTLQIENGISDKNLNDFLRNTTLQNLQSLHIRFNNFMKLESESLRGLPNLLTLDAGWSHITSIESTILESSANRIQQVIFTYNELETLPVDIFNIKSYRTNFTVYLQQNKLKTLPEGIFDMARNSSGTLAVYLENNDWHCDCDLAWLQNYIKEGIIDVKDEPKCESPEINRNTSLRYADFSYCNTTTLPSASSTTTIEAITSSTTDITTESSSTATENMTTNTITTSTHMTTDITTSSTELSTHTTPSSTGDTDNTTASSTEITTNTTTSSTEDTNNTTTSSTELSTDTPTSSTKDTDNTNTSSTELTTDTTTPSTEDIDNTITSSTELSTYTTTSSTGDTDNTITSSTELSTDTTTSSTEDTDNITASSTEITIDTTTSSTEDNGNPITSSTEITTDTTTLSTGEDYGEVLCHCPTCRTKYMPVSTETNSEASTPKTHYFIRDFEIVEDDQLNQITVKIGVQNEHVLIWMTRSQTNYIDCKYDHCNAGKERSSPYFTASFSSDPDTSYTICAANKISENKVIICTRNCRAYTTLPSPSYRAWLLNKDTGITLLILCFTLLVSVTAGATTIYYVLLHNPELINGNKRVIVVNCHTNQVIMIMPKGYCENERSCSSHTSYNTASLVRPVMQQPLSPQL
jgi:hypothetical protein